MLMCLSSLGGFLAEALQCAYSRLCRRQRKSDITDDDIDADEYGNVSQNHLVRSENDEVNAQNVFDLFCLKFPSSKHKIKYIQL